MPNWPIVQAFVRRWPVGLATHTTEKLQIEVTARPSYRSLISSICRKNGLGTRPDAHKIQRLSAQKSHHHGHLALNGKNSSANFLRPPLGLAPFAWLVLAQMMSGLAPAS